MRFKQLQKAAAILMLASFIFSAVMPAGKAWAAYMSWEDLLEMYVVGYNSDGSGGSGWISSGGRARNQSVSVTNYDVTGVTIRKSYPSDNDYNSFNIGYTMNQATAQNVARMLGSSTFATTNYIGATALGSEANVDSQNSTALGYKASADYYDSVSVGAYAQVRGILSTSVGKDASAAAYAVALGHTANAGSYATALGYNAYAGSYAIAFGSRANASNDAIAIGVNACAAAPYATVVGYNAGAINEGVALGDEAIASEYAAVGLGSCATASHRNSVALGAGSVSKAGVAVSSATIAGRTYTFSSAKGGTTYNTVSIGDTGKERQIVNVANGAIACGSTDAVNGGQIFDIISQLPSSEMLYQADGSTANTSVSTGYLKVAGNTAKAAGKTNISTAIAKSGDNAVITVSLGEHINVTDVTTGAAGNNSVLNSAGLTVAASGKTTKVTGSAVNTTDLYATTITAGTSANKTVIKDNSVAMGAAGNNSELKNTGLTVAASGKTTSINAAAAALGGTLSVAGNTTVGGTLTVTGATNMKGNVTLGDAAADIVAVNGTATFTPKATFKAGADMSGQKITNVADGTAATDAVNYGQLTGHTGNTTVHITADERTKWNNAATTATSAQSAANSAVQTVTMNGTEGLQLKTVGGTVSNVSLLDLQTTQSKANASAITEIKNSAVMKSGITSALVGKYNTYVTANGLSGNGQAISNVQAQTIVANGTYAATTGQVYNATLSSVSLGTDKKTLTIKENSTTKTVDLSALETTQSKANASAIGNRTYTKDNYVADGQTLTASIDALDSALGAKISADGNVIKKSATNTINQNISALDTKIGKMSADGSYAKQANTISANLTALDTQLKTVTNNEIKAVGISNGKITFTQNDNTTDLAVQTQDYAVSGIAVNSANKGRIDVTTKDRYSSASSAAVYDLSGLETAQGTANATAIGNRQYTYNTGAGGFLTNNQSVTASLNALNNNMIKSVAVTDAGKIQFTQVDGTTDIISNAIHDYKIDSVSYDKITKKLTITEKDAYSGTSNAKTIEGFDTSRVMAADNSGTVTIYGGATAKIAGGTTDSTNAADTKNITTNVAADGSGAKVEVTLNKDITLDSVTTGAAGNNSVLSNTGLAVKASGKTTTVTGSAVNTTDLYATTITAGTGATTKVTLSDNAVKIGNATYITNAGLNANSLVIKNVAAGTADDNAVNYSQIKNNVADITLNATSGVLTKKTTAGATATVGRLRDERVTGISYNTSTNKVDVTVADYYGGTTGNTFDVDLSNLHAKVAAETTSGEKYVSKFTAGRNTQITETDGVATIGTKDDVGFNSVIVYNKANPGADGYMTMDKSGISYADILDENFNPKEGTKFVGLNKLGFGIGEYINESGEIKIDETSRTSLSHEGLVVHGSTFIDMSDPSAAAYINANDKQIKRVASGGEITSTSGSNTNAANIADIYTETRAAVGAGRYISSGSSAGQNLKNLDTQLADVSDKEIDRFEYSGNQLKAITRGNTEIAVAQIDDYRLTSGEYTTMPGGTATPALKLTSTSHSGTTSETYIDISGLSGGALLTDGSVLPGKNINFETPVDEEGHTHVLITVTPNPSFKNVTVKDSDNPQAGDTYTEQAPGSITVGHYVEDPNNAGTYVKSEDSILTGAKLTVGGKDFINTADETAYINAHGKKISNLSTEGAIFENSAYAVSGGELFRQINTEDGAYITSGTNVAANLKALDTQLKTVSDSTITGFEKAGDRLIQAVTADGTKLDVAELRDTLIDDVAFNEETNSLDITVKDRYDTTGLEKTTYSADLSGLKANIGVETTGGGTADVSSLTAGRNIQITQTTTGVAEIGTKDDVGFNSVLVYNKENPGADGYMAMDKSGIAYTDTLDENFNPKAGTKFVGLNSQGFGIGEYIQNEAGEIVVDTAARTSLSHKGLVVHGNTFIDVSDPSAAAYINAQGRQIANVASGISEEAPFNAANKNAANVGDIYTATTMKTAGSYYDANSAATTAAANIDKALGTVARGNLVRAYDATDAETTVSANINAIDRAIGDIKNLNGGGSLTAYDKTTGAGTVAANLNSLDATATAIKGTIGDYTGTTAGAAYAVTGTIAGDIKAIDSQVAANAAAAARNEQAIAAVSENITVEAGSYKHIIAGADVAGNLKALDAAITDTQGSEITNFATSETGKVTAAKTDGTTLDVAQLQDYKLSEATLNGKTLVITSKDAYGTGVVEKAVDLSSLEAETVIQNGDTSYKGDGKNISIQTVEDPEHEGKYITTLKLSDEITDVTSVTTKPDEEGRVTRLDNKGLYVANGETAVTAEKISVGASSLTGTGLTVNGKNYITEEGLNANGKITGVQAGELSASSKDAVNGTQLWNTNQKVAANEENIERNKTAAEENKRAIAAINDNITVTAGSYSYITAGADAAANLKALDTAVTNAKGNEITHFATNDTGKVTAAKADGSRLDVAQLRDYEVTSGDYNADSKYLTLNSKNHYNGEVSSTGINLDGLATNVTINNTDGKKISFHNGRNMAITTEETETEIVTTIAMAEDVVHKSVKIAEGKENETVIDEKGITVGTSSLNGDKLVINETTSLGGQGLTVNGKTYIDEDGVLNANGGKISGVQEGDLSANSTDAVNGSQLWNTNQQVAANKDEIAKINGTVGDYTKARGLYTDTGTIAGDIKSLDTTMTANVKATAKNAEDIAAINSGITVEAGTYNYITAGSDAAGNLKALDAAIANSKGNEITSFATSETGKVTARKTDGTTLDVAQLQDYKLSEATLNGKTLVITSKDAYGTGMVEKTVDLSGLEAETIIQNGDTSYKGDGKNVSIQTVEDPEHKGQYITTLKLTDEITDVTSITTKPDENGKVTRIDSDGIYVADGEAAITKDTVKVGDSSLTDSGLVINGKSYITEEGFNANGKITGVKAGELSSTSKDAVNGSQLWNTNQRVSANEENIAAINSNITVEAGTYRYITSGADVAGNLKTLDAAIANSKGNEITSFATSGTGKVTAKKADGSTLNVAQLQDYKFNEATLNGKTLVITSKDAYGTGIVEKKIDLSGLEAETIIQNGDTSFKGDGNVSWKTVEDPEHEGKYITTLQLSDEVTDITSITTKADADGKITKVDSEGIYVANGEAAITKDTVKVGDSSLTGSELTVNGTTYITEEGLNANGKISGVEAGELSSTSTEAVNGSQLHETNQRVSANEEKITDNTTMIKVLDNRIDNIMVSGIESVSAKKLADDDKSASANADGSIAEAYNSAVSEGSEAGIAIGYEATVGYEGGEIGGTDTKAKNSIAIGRGATVTGANSIAIGTGHVVTGNNSGAFGDPNTVEADASYAYGNDNVIYKTGTENGGNTHVIGNKNYVKADNTFVLGSNVGTEEAPITANNSVILGNGSTISKDVTDAVVSVGNDKEGGQRRIINLADGINATDAATYGQLNNLAVATGQAIGAMQNELNSVSGEVKEVGAMSAALAGLHYVEPTGEEGDKFVGAVAYGNYRGESAGAIGVAYKPNPNFMVSASTSVGQNYNAYNAGASLKFGKGETAVTRAELKKQVKFVNEENRVLKTQVVNLASENAEMGAEIQTLKNDKAAQDNAIEALKKENAEIKEMLKKLIK